MRTVIVLVPMKPNLHPLLKARQRELLAGIEADNPTLSVEVVVDERGPGDGSVTTISERVNHTAAIRQAMIDDYLRPRHDFVLWIDADVCDYPPDLPTQLIERGGGNVAAPMVYLEGHGERFYDVAGFVEDGKWTSIQKPFFRQPGPVYRLDSVGCVYLVPADVYRRGARHVGVPGFTDHLAICRYARDAGYQVLAFAEIVAIHADLRLYGEAWH